jgi:hypothetical protein
MRVIILLFYYMAYATTWLPHGVIWDYSEILTGDDVLQSNLEIFGDERFDELRYQIVDLTKVSSVEVTKKHMRKVAHLDMAAARTNPRVRVAVVATTCESVCIGDLYDQLTLKKSPWVTKIFNSREEAEAWAQSSTRIRQPVDKSESD